MGSVAVLAVIIGVAKVGPSDSRGDVIRAVLAQVELASVDLKKYRRSDDIVCRVFIVTSSVFSDEKEWPNSSDNAGFLDGLAAPKTR